MNQNNEFMARAITWCDKYRLEFNNRLTAQHDLRHNIYISKGRVLLVHSWHPSCVRTEYLLNHDIIMSIYIYKVDQLYRKSLLFWTLESNVFK